MLKIFCLSVLLSAFKISTVSGQCESGTNTLDPSGFVWKDDSRISLESSIKGLYRGNINNAGRIILWIEKMDAAPARIAGYRFLFNEIQTTKNFYSIPVMTLYYRAMKMIAAHPDDADLKWIMENSPKSVKEFPFDKKIRIKNVQYNELMTASSWSSEEDTEKYYPYFWSGLDCSVGFCWWECQTVENGSGFRLYNKEINSYLVADTRMQDAARRNVFNLSAKMSEIQGGDVWQFEPVDSTYFRLKNIFWDEYLYAPGNQFKHDPLKRPVFNWANKGCDSNQCRFIISEHTK